MVRTGRRRGPDQLVLMRSRKGVWCRYTGNHAILQGGEEVRRWDGWEWSSGVGWNEAMGA